jgi:hypothetical protein
MKNWLPAESGSLVRAIANIKAAALNHEVINNPMEYRVFVEAFIDVSEKVFDCFWGFISKEYNGDVALTGFKLNDRVLRERR